MNEFIKLVAEMREAQKNYFKIRTKGALVAAKELENKVDSLLDSKINVKFEDIENLIHLSTTASTMLDYQEYKQYPEEFRKFVDEGKNAVEIIRKALKLKEDPLYGTRSTAKLF